MAQMAHIYMYLIFFFIILQKKSFLVNLLKIPMLLKNYLF